MRLFLVGFNILLLAFMAFMAGLTIDTGDSTVWFIQFGGWWIFTMFTVRALKKK